MLLKVFPARMQDCVAIGLKLHGDEKNNDVGDIDSVPKNEQQSVIQFLKPALCNTCILGYSHMTDKLRSAENVFGTSIRLYVPNIFSALPNVSIM